MTRFVLAVCLAGLIHGSAFAAPTDWWCACAPHETTGPTPKLAWDKAKVIALGLEFSRMARETYVAADGDLSSTGWGLDELYGLRQDASTFNVWLEEDASSPSGSFDGFRRLEIAFNATRSTFASGKFHPDVVARYEQLQPKLKEICEYYFGAGEASSKR